MSDYDRVAKAIAFIAENITEQPSLEAIAAQVHLSPFHFQRLFCRWAGISPKRFQQALTLERGKVLLAQARPLLEVASAVGLSSGSRLHDHFVQLEAVSPGEYKRRGRDLKIYYGLHESPFGKVFLASTQRGICQMMFLQNTDIAGPVKKLQSLWPLASISENKEITGESIAEMFTKSPSANRPLSLHVAGTNFQVSVWKALLRIPYGSVTSYSQLAAALGHLKSARAVGNAVGANPIAFVVPCHRVIQQSGALGGYRWGVTRKRVMQVWERA